MLRLSVAAISLPAASVRPRPVLPETATRPPRPRPRTGRRPWPSSNPTLGSRARRATSVMGAARPPGRPAGVSYPDRPAPDRVVPQGPSPPPRALSLPTHHPQLRVAGADQWPISSSAVGDFLPGSFPAAEMLACPHPTYATFTMVNVHLSAGSAGASNGLAQDQGPCASRLVSRQPFPRRKLRPRRYGGPPRH